MNKKEIFNYISETGFVYLASTDGDKPRVRAMAIIEAGENGIIINTGKKKDVYKQLCANPNAEICCFDPAKGIQIRVSGVLEQTEDRVIQDKVLEKLPFLKPFVEKNGYESLATYIMKKGVASIWTMETNFAPKVFVEL
jgi:pyridoxamine 5'-phosphate oxidase